MYEYEHEQCDRRNHNGTDNAELSICGLSWSWYCNNGRGYITS